MQIGSFLFTPEPEPGKIWIQHATDGEGGRFNISDLPNGIRLFLKDERLVGMLTPRGHAEADTLMAPFWRKHF